MKITRVYSNKKLNILFYIYFILLFVIFLGIVSEICYSKHTVSPGHINIELSSPEEDGFANHHLKLKNNKHEENIYYYASDFTLNKKKYKHKIPAQYLQALTPYDSYFQPLDNSVLFLAAKQDQAEVVIKLSKEAWNLVPAGDYWGSLKSSDGREVDVKISINKPANIIIFPDEISINATEGPGIYQGTNKVTVKINNNNKNWILYITAEPLVIENTGYTSHIPPDNLFLAVDNDDGPYNSLIDGYQLDSLNYGSMAVFDLYLQARVEWSHQAGNYTGDIVFTLSE